MSRTSKAYITDPVFEDMRLVKARKNANTIILTMQARVEFDHPDSQRRFRALTEFEVAVPSSRGQRLERSAKYRAENIHAYLHECKKAGQAPNYENYVTHGGAATRQDFDAVLRTSRSMSDAD